MDAESQKYIDKSRLQAAQLRAAGNVEDADGVEAGIARIEARGGLTRWEREHFPLLEIVGEVMADFIKDLRKRDDEIKSELRHALAEINSRISTLEASRPPNDQSTEIATDLQRPLKVYLYAKIATAAPMSGQKDELRFTHGHT